MCYDQMTETEAEEYLALYTNPPTSIKGAAERFIELAKRGWSGTRASDDCFEMGNGNAVLLLVLRRVQAEPELEKVLRDQGAWPDLWNEHLRNIDVIASLVTTFEIQWRGITIELVYKPRWSEAVETLAHLEIMSVEPLRAPLPITETGYRSHFFHQEQALSPAELTALVEQLLDDASRERKWQPDMQLTLF